MTTKLRFFWFLTENSFFDGIAHFSNFYFWKKLTGSKFNIHWICWRTGHVQSSAWGEIFNFLHFCDFVFLWFRFFNFYQSCILPKNIYKKLVSRSNDVDWGQILSRAKVNGWVIKPVYYSSNVYGFGLSIIRTFCSRWPYSGIFVFGFSKLTCFWSGMIECVFSEFDYLHRRWKCLKSVCRTKYRTNT